MRSHVTSIALSLVTVALVCPSTARATTTYTYTGNDFDTIVGPTYTTSMSVSGSFTTSAPLPRNMPLTDIREWELSYGFTDDVQIRTDADSWIVEFEVATDADGMIETWNISVVELPVATTIGEIRHLVDTHGGETPEEKDLGGTGHCSQVTNSVCSSFAMTDYGQLSDGPGTWVRTGDVPPAPKTYSYEGNFFNDVLGGTYSTSDRVTGTFDTAAPLAPNLPLTDITDAVASYSFFDGVLTRNAEDSYVVLFKVGTDGNGDIDEWSIFVVEGPPATAIGEIRHYTETHLLPAVVTKDLGATGQCGVIVDGICVGFNSSDYGATWDDPGMWDGPPPSSPSVGRYDYTGNTYSFTQGPSYDMTMNLIGSFTTAEPLPASMAFTDITHTVTGFDYFDGVQTRTMADSWGWVFAVETDANGDIFRWLINLQEEPEATTVGEIRHRMDSFSFENSGLLDSGDQGGTGHCTDVIGGTCTTWILDDYGAAGFDPGGWTTTVTSLTNPIPTLSLWGAVFLVFVLAALGVLRLWRM